MVEEEARNERREERPAATVLIDSTWKDGGDVATGLEIVYQQEGSRWFCPL
jgi:hypothetical protein